MRFFEEKFSQQHSLHYYFSLLTSLASKINLIYKKMNKFINRIYGEKKKKAFHTLFEFYNS